MFNTYNESKECLMQIGENLACTFNSPKALKGEQVFGLPPYAPRNAYMVDEYVSSPKTWMHGSAKVSSYFVAVKPEHGLWLDFNKCFNHSHHVAILISIQGVNPITGMPLIDAPMRLEQYREKCPKHNKDFGAELYCEDCGYKWTLQNYLSTTGTPHGMLWLDGFRADDGSVRQYYFTEEECKGVASQIIGDQRVFAIGIAFYLSKKQKINKSICSDNFNIFTSMFGYSDVKCWNSTKKLLASNHFDDSPQVSYCDSNSIRQFASGDANLDILHDYDCETSYDPTELKEVAAKMYEVAAGAKINQVIHHDPENIDFWEDSPAGMIYINYTDEETVKKILEGGKKDRTKKGEGFMADLVVGNV